MSHRKYAAAAAKSLQSCLTLCDPIDSSPPGSSVSGILQARILEWIAISFSNACMHAKSLQLYPTLCDPMDSSPPGSSVSGILQARILEWVAISFSNACILSRFSCVWLCNPMDCRPPGSSVHGILQARILEWLPCPPPGDLPHPGIELASLTSPALAGGFFTTSATWEAP